MKRSIGIVRETYNFWERRAPITPNVVKKLIQVLIQPCSKRIFPNEEYERAGALVQEDLTSANTIFGVKQVPIDALIPNKTYVFFSHTIKAQPENMPLLDNIIEKNIRLIDYECIADFNSENKLVRKVAFGDFAGKAGMIDCFRMVGESLLKNHSINTPFLNIGSAYMHQSYEEAIMRLKEVGDKVLESKMFKHEPLVFCFTGNGNVTQGALEVFKTLNPILCDVNTLEATRESVINSNDENRSIIGCLLEKKDLVSRIESGKFDAVEYALYPERYEHNFTKIESISKYCQVLVNGIYWDKRYPRVVCNKTVHNMDSLHSIADLSCDINGSIQLLSRPTSIEDPFLKVPLDSKELYILGVDILPSELPRESSLYFGEKLSPYLEMLSTPMETTSITDLPNDLQRAVITDKAGLTQEYRQISMLRKEREQEERMNKKSEVVGSFKVMYKLYGHIFDTQAINIILDEVESDNGQAKLIEVAVRPDRQTSALLEISMKEENALTKLERKLEQMIEDIDNKSESQKIQLIRLDNYFDEGPITQRVLGGVNLNGKRAFSTQRQIESKKITLFGSGMMSYPIVEYLTRQKDIFLTVASYSDSELAELKDFLDKLGRTNFDLKVCDVTDRERTKKIVSDADVCMSLLPAAQHSFIMEPCLETSTDLVTASYIDYSNDVAALDKELVSKGTTFLFELGVDPGMDHMSAKKLIDEIHSSGGQIKSFSSVCGGLPKIEEKYPANIFNYKFSWSPKGVLNALKNDAVYLQDNDVVNIPSSELLPSATPYDFIVDNNNFEMECLPNRDSLKYKDLYGLGDASSIFRGTLRYRGFSRYMHEIQKLGLLIEDKLDLVALKTALASGKYDNQLTLFLEALATFATSDSSLIDLNAVDVLCAFLSRELSYSEGEKDAIFMEHKIVYTDVQEKERAVQSQLLLYGDEKSSAMAKTVGVSAAIGAEALAKDKTSNKVFSKGGLIIPTQPELYTPFLKKLEEENIIFTEKQIY